jgi:hypothetical protein
MGCPVVTISGLQNLREECSNLRFRTGSLEEKIEDRHRGRVQQMCVPGQRIKDDSLIIEVPVPQSIDNREAPA